MPYLIVSSRAHAGIRRCYLYLWERSPAAADRAQSVIRQQINRLKRSPYIGRPYDPPDPDEAEEGEDLRELVIRFGGKGKYLALYHYAEEEDAIHIVAFKHGQEARYF